jgi:hypothetical protein
MALRFKLNRFILSAPNYSDASASFLWWNCYATLASYRYRPYVTMNRAGFRFFRGGFGTEIALEN